MVKVREFCCGCSLRSGTFAIAWSLLIYSTLLLISNVFEYSSTRRRYAELEKYTSSTYPPPPAYFLAYHVIRFITGIAVSVTALWAIHKNEIKFLNGLYWYLGYTAASFLLSVILLIFEPVWEENLTETTSILRYYSYDNIEIRLMLSLLYLFISGIVVYFTLIVKSYRDYGLRNEGQNVQFVGPDATTVGYIAA